MDLLTLILIVFTLAVETVVLVRYFRWTYPKALGVATLMNALSFIVATVAWGMTMPYLPTYWFTLWFFTTHYLRAIATFLLVWWLARIITEICVCRFFTRNFAFGYVAAVIALVNCATLLPGSVNLAMQSKPHITPSSFTLQRFAPPLPTTSAMLFYYVPEQGEIVEYSLNSAKHRVRAHSVPPRYGYRVCANGNALVIPGASNIVWIATNDTAKMHTCVLSAPATNTALIAVSPCVTRVAIAADDLMYICHISDTMEPDTLPYPSDFTVEWVAWTADGTALCIKDNEGVSIVCPDETKPVERHDTVPSLTAAWLLPLHLASPSDAVFSSQDITITVQPEDSVTFAYNHESVTLRIKPDFVFHGIELLDDTHVFLMRIGSEIVAVDVDTHAIGHIGHGILPITTTPRYALWQETSDNSTYHDE